MNHLDTFLAGSEHNKLLNEFITLIHFLTGSAMCERLSVLDRSEGVLGINRPTLSVSVIQIYGSADPDLDLY